MSEEEGENTQALWYANFRNEPDEKMETAMIMVINSSLFFPNVAEIRKALDELNQDLRYTQDKPRQLERGQSRSEAKANLERMQKYIAAFAAGNYDKSAWVDELRPFAKTIFPEIGDETILRNYNELSHARDRAEYCRSCIWLPADCEYKGFVPVLTMESTGFVHEGMIPCHKRQAAKFDKSA